MLTSSVGLSIDMHYCQGNLKSLVLFGKAKSCHETKETKTCHHKKMASSNKQDKNINKTPKDNCCHNENITISKTNLDLQHPQFNSFTNVQLKFIASYLVCFLNNDQNNNLQSHYSQYIPPLPHNDVQILYQVFRI